MGRDWRNERDILIASTSCFPENLVRMRGLGFLSLISAKLHCGASFQEHCNARQYR
jgi:hypothetical protein